MKSSCTWLAQNQTQRKESPPQLAHEKIVTTHSTNEQVSKHFERQQYAESKWSEENDRHRSHILPQQLYAGVRVPVQCCAPAIRRFVPEQYTVYKCLLPHHRTLCQRHRDERLFEAQKWIEINEWTNGRLDDGSNEMKRKTKLQFTIWRQNGVYSIVFSRYQLHCHSVEWLCVCAIRRCHRLKLRGKWRPTEWNSIIWWNSHAKESTTSSSPSLPCSTKENYLKSLKHCVLGQKAVRCVHFCHTQNRTNWM